ncbi:MAG: hypothetical protein DRI94_12500, partial [Bacteroidetes bacterium]
NLIMKTFYYYFIFSILLLSSCSDGTNNTELDVFSGIIPNLVTKTLPFTLTHNELEKLYNNNSIQISNSDFKNFIQKDNQDSLVNVKALINIKISDDLNVLIISTEFKWTEEMHPINYQAVTFYKGQYSSKSPFFDYIDEMDGSYAEKVVVKKSKSNVLISLKIISDNGIGIDTTGLNLTDKEIIDLFYLEKNMEITSIGEFKPIKNNNKTENKQTNLVYNGSIGNQEVVIKLFKDSEGNYYGKIYYIKSGNESLIGISKSPEMSMGYDFSVYTNKGNNDALTLNFVGNKLLGQYYINNDMSNKSAVNLSESGKPYNDFKKTEITKIKNSEFKDYISKFAQVKSLSNFTLVEDNKINGLKKIKKSFVNKFVNEKLSPYCFYHKKYYYGFSFDNNKGISCVFFASNTINDKQKVHYVLAEYSYSGKVKAFDFIDKLPVKLNIRSYDLREEEPKDLFRIGFYNTMIDTLPIYIDIPSGLNINTIGIYEINDDTKESKQVLYEYLSPFDFPHINYINLIGNFGCNNLSFEITSNSEDAIILSKEIEMHCGE